MNVPHPIIEQLRVARRARRWSQQALADRIGVARYTVAQWETGRRRPRITDADAYASALGYTLTLALTPTKEARRDAR